MRPRSGALHANSNEEYLRLASQGNYMQNMDHKVHKEQRNHQCNYDHYQNHHLRVKNLNSSMRLQNPSPRVNSMSPRLYNTSPRRKIDQQHIDDFDFSENHMQTKTNRYSKLLSSSYRLNIDYSEGLPNTQIPVVVDDNDDGDFTGNSNNGMLLKQQISKIIIIGGQNTGKHALIDMIFKGNDDTNTTATNYPNDGMKKSIHNHESYLDLMIKKDPMNNSRKYKVWIRNLDRHDKYDTLIRVYYKAIEVFIFLYSISDKESYDKIDNCISNIHELLHDKKNSLTILIGNKTDQPRIVDYEQGLILKNKYGLNWFMETTTHSQETILQIYNKINEYTCMSCMMMNNNQHIDMMMNEVND